MTAGRKTADLRQSSKTKPQARRTARPDTDSMSDPKAIWKAVEAGKPEPADTAPGGDRVADASDAGGVQPSPYEPETSAGEVARQTKRDKGSKS